MKNAMNKIEIYTDGACSGNPGIGGWGAIIKDSSSERDLCGGEKYTTNNRMELMAAISALNAVKEPSEIDLYTDSQYVKNGITVWIKNWIARGWKTADKKPVKNVELWMQLQEAVERHNVSWHWVEGHAGHEMNERVDSLARSQCQKR